MRDLFLEGPKAQSAIETAGYGQLGRRTRAHGQTDQASLAPAAARLGDCSLETLAGAHRIDIHGVRQGGGHSRGFFGCDTCAAHGLLKGFAPANLDRDGFRRRQSSGHAGGGKGLISQSGDLGLGKWWNFFRFRRLINATGKKRHRDRGHRREGVGRDAHRLATWIELSHRSPKSSDARRRQTHW